MNPIQLKPNTQQCLAENVPSAIKQQFFRKENNEWSVCHFRVFIIHGIENIINIVVNMTATDCSSTFPKFSQWCSAQGRVCVRPRQKLPKMKTGDRDTASKTGCVNQDWDNGR